MNIFEIQNLTGNGYCTSDFIVKGIIRKATKEEIKKKSRRNKRESCYK